MRTGDIEMIMDHRGETKLTEGKGAGICTVETPATMEMLTREVMTGDGGSVLKMKSLHGLVTMMQKEESKETGTVKEAPDCIGAKDPKGINVPMKE